MSYSGHTEVSRCTLCPRRCGADRSGERGFCGADSTLEVSRVCIHRGEEPPINPIVNVFFRHCNLHCIYCQNWQISGELGMESGAPEAVDVDELAERICALLPSEGGLLGLVTAAHYADRLPELIEAVHARGFRPAVVYNSSGYESVDTLRSLEGLIDIYLPDFKYNDPLLASTYSHAADYPAVAQAALREMRRQVGAGLKTDGEHAYRGLIVRHLVLPDAVENSLSCLDWLADEFPFGLHLSLMAQYYPPRVGLSAPLDRTLRPDEYKTVVDHAERLGLTDGWIQELEATENYRPDFDKPDNPFEP